MSIDKKSDGELKMIAHDFHDKFETLDSDSSCFDGYLNKVVKELMRRGYTISVHNKIVIDK